MVNIGVISSSYGRSVLPPGGGGSASLQESGGIYTLIYTSLESERNKTPYIKEVILTPDPSWNVGATVTANIVGNVNGPFTEGPHEYQWYFLNTQQSSTLIEIEGATSSSYTFQPADETKYLVCRARFVQLEGVNNKSEWKYSIISDVIGPEVEVTTTTTTAAPTTTTTTTAASTTTTTTTAQGSGHPFEDYFNVETGESVNAGWNDPGVDVTLVNLGTGSNYTEAAATKPVLDGDKLVFVRANGNRLLSTPGNTTHPPIFEFFFKGRATAFNGAMYAMGSNTLLGTNAGGQFVGNSFAIAGDLNEHVFRVRYNGVSCIVQIDKGAETVFTEATTTATRTAIGSTTSGGNSGSIEFKVLKRTADGVLLTAQEIDDEWAYFGFP